MSNTNPVHVKHHDHSNESDIIRTVFAGIGSVCAASVTHPIDTVKIRL